MAEVVEQTQPEPNTKVTTGQSSTKSGKNAAVNVELIVRHIKNFAESKECPQALRDPLQKYVAPGVEKAFDLLEKLIPHIQKAIEKAQELWIKLQPYKPELLFPSLVGLVLCFFGGSFLTLIAAVEAFRLSSYEPLLEAATVLYDDFKKVWDANEKDNDKDENNDGVPDVLQVSAKEVVQRKLFLFLKVVDPNRLMGAVAVLNAGFLAIVATLKLEFAKALTLGNAIYGVVEPPLERFAYPIVEKIFLKIFPEEYKKWCKPIFVSVIRSIVISWAWFLQRVISAFHSSIRGGLMFSRNILEYLDKMGIYHVNHEDTYLDEIVGFAFAFLGLFFQLRYRFDLPFPLNILLFPFSLAEWFLMWAVTSR